MATTKLWHIKGRLKDLIEYVENPAKTASPHLQDFLMSLPMLKIQRKPHKEILSLLLTV